jgi:helix-turn-helix protein
MNAASHLHLQGANTMQPGEPSPADQILEEKIVTKDDGSLRVLHGTARPDGFTTQDFVQRYPATQTDQDSGNCISQLDLQKLEPFVDAKTAGEFLHYSVGSIKQMARDGRIPAHPFGGGVRKRWYFLISELAEHLRAQVNSAHGEAGRDKTQRRVI